MKIVLLFKSSEAEEIKNYNNQLNIFSSENYVCLCSLLYCNTNAKVHKTTEHCYFKRRAKKMYIRSEKDFLLNSVSLYKANMGYIKRLYNDYNWERLS